MTKISPTIKRFFLVSLASWLLLAVLTNMIGNTAPVLFQFLRYFLACSLFGLGLGFFAQDKIGAEKSHRPMGNVWAIWLALICLLLFCFSAIDYPGGLSNAVALALLDESRDIYDFSLLKHSIITDVFTVLFCATLLFATTQLFVSPGRELKKLAEKEAESGLAPLPPFALGAAGAWLIYAGLSQLGAPPALILVVPCLIFLTACDNLKLCATLSLFAIISTLYTNLAAFPRPSTSGAVSIKSERSGWINGQRLDTISLKNGAAPLCLSVYLDRLPFQILPGPDLSAEDAAVIQKTFGLPQFICDFRLLPYMAMPPVKGKKALILAAGLGSETQVCQRQGAAEITAVEPHRWLTDTATRQSSNPFCGASVKLVWMDPLQFLRQSKDRYDLIFYTLQSAASPANPFTPLCHNDFLFTTESIGTAINHLNQGGRIVFATPPANEISRLRLAATALALCPKLEASLTTPFCNYLIVAKNDDSFAAADNTVPLLRKKLGGKIVNHEQWLASGAAGVAPYTTDRPFMMGQAPMMTLADTFFYVMSMLAFFMSMRRQTPDTMLQNITRLRCRSLLLGAIFMVALIKALITVVLQSGATAPVIFGAIVYGFAVASAGSSIGLITKRLPTWVLWTALMTDLGFDATFNYTAVSMLAAGQVNIVATAVLPWLAVLLTSLLQAQSNKEGENRSERFALFLIGLSLGCLFAISALFNGLAWLDLLAADLAVLSALLTWLPSPKPQGIITPT